MAIVSNNGVLIYYEVIGTGFPIVLIHGIHGSGYDWKEFGFVKLLKGYEIILIDLRGHGKSSKLHQPDDYDPKKQASDIICVLDDLEHDKAIIWGYSYGARMGVAVGIYYPQYVSKLIIGGMHPYPVANLYPKIRFRQDLLKIGLEKYLKEMNIKLSDKLEELFLKNDRVALVQMDESILQWRGFGQDLNKLRVVNFWILLYLGSEDKAYLDLVKQFCSEFDNVQYVQIDGMRHFDAMSESTQILKRIKHFLNSN